MSQVKIPTSTFKTAIGKSIKSAIVKGGVDPQSAMIQLTHKNNMLSLRTTNTRNILIVRIPDIPGDDFEVVINIDKFYDIITKTTSDEISLEIEGGNLIFKGNGKYRYPLIVESDGPMTFEPIRLLQDPELDVELSLKEMVDITKCCGKFIGTAFADPRVCGYFFGKSVLTSDNVVACFYEKEYFKDHFMFFDDTFNLLTYMNGEKVRLLKKGEDIQLVGEDFLITSKIHPNSDEYPEEEFRELLLESYDSGVVVDAKEIIAAIDRINVFSSALLSQNKSTAVFMNFNEDRLVLTCEDESAEEYVPYKDKDNFKTFTCQVSPADLISAITMEGMADVKLMYSNEIALRIDAGTVKRIIGFMDPSEVNISVDTSETPMEDDDDELSRINEEMSAFSETSSGVGSLDDLEW